jgi:uncharacterized protein (DUF1330 family)
MAQRLAVADMPAAHDISGSDCVRSPMSAYVISEVEVRDAPGFEAYRSMAAKAIDQYGGRYLVRGGAAEAAEGGPPPKVLIVVEFPSMERLREWYVSAEYAEALKHRRTALDRRLIFVEGVAVAP